jgi:hypothetical protein
MGVAVVNSRRVFIVPGMRKRTREGTRSPGHQIFCSQPEASGVLARRMIGLNPRP